MDITEQVRQFIVTNFYVPDPASLKDDTSLLESGVVDSTGMLEVISFIEETFKISVAETDMVPENLDSIARISAYVTRRSH